MLENKNERRQKSDTRQLKTLEKSADEVKGYKMTRCKLQFQSNGLHYLFYVLQLFYMQACYRTFNRDICPDAPQ